MIQAILLAAALCAAPGDKPCDGEFCAGCTRMWHNDGWIWWCQNRGMNRVKLVAAVMPPPKPWGVGPERKGFTGWVYVQPADAILQGNDPWIELRNAPGGQAARICELWFSDPAVLLKVKELNGRKVTIVTTVARHGNWHVAVYIVASKADVFEVTEQPGDPA